MLLGHITPKGATIADVTRGRDSVGYSFHVLKPRPQHQHHDLRNIHDIMTEIYSKDTILRIYYCVNIPLTIQSDSIKTLGVNTNHYEKFCRRLDNSYGHEVIESQIRLRLFCLDDVSYIYL